MEQTKIFSGTMTQGDTCFADLEEEANLWLAANGEHIEVISRHVNTVAGVNNLDNSFVNCTIVYFYRDLS